MKRLLQTLLFLLIFTTPFDVRSEDTIPQASNNADTITLNADNVDITTVLKWLSLTREVNIIASNKVTGKVSVNLYQIPFEDALDSILSIGGFTYYKRAGVIFVTTEADKAGLAIHAADLSVRTFKIDHADPGEMLEAIKEFLSPAGKAILSDETRTISVLDAPEYLDLAENLVRQQDVPPRQVLVSSAILRVTYNEGTSTDLELDRFHPDTVLGTTASSSSNDTRGGAATDTALSVLDAWRVTSGGGGLLWSRIWKDRTLLLTALATKGKIDTLAAPEVTILDGKTADLIIGEKLGFKTIGVSDSGLALENVQFLEVGTSLRVTPRISKENLIRMEIEPKISTGQINNNTGVPDEQTTELNSTMIVHDGETIVIGGLIETSKERKRSQVPILGDIPYIGLLFGKNDWIERKSELIILITPHIVGMTTTAYMKDKMEIYMEDSEYEPKDFMPELPVTPPYKVDESEWQAPQKSQGKSIDLGSIDTKSETEVDLASTVTEQETDVAIDIEDSISRYGIDEDLDISRYGIHEDSISGYGIDEEDFENELFESDPSSFLRDMPKLSQKFLKDHDRKIFEAIEASLPVQPNPIQELSFDRMI